MIDEFIQDLNEIKDEVWGYDIPSPTVPEYREHHQQIQELMKFVKKKINKWEAKNEPIGVITGGEYDCCPKCKSIVGSSAHYCKKCGAYLREEIKK